MDASIPQTDRELLLKLNGEIENLSKSIHEFNNTLRDIEDKKIAALDKRLKDLEDWKGQILGGWKMATVIWIIITGGIVAFVKSFF